MFLFREHRGSLSESLETTQEFSTKSSLLEYLNSIYVGVYINEENLLSTNGKFDPRTNWNTYTICISNYGVLGFTNMDLTDL